MKHLFLPISLIAGSLLLFSFSTHEPKNAAYESIEVLNGTSVTRAQFAEFSKYENKETTADKGTWSFRLETWTNPTPAPKDIKKLETTLNQN